MEIFKQVPLYRYLALCNESGMERTVLDCGAGGDLHIKEVGYAFGMNPDLDLTRGKIEYIIDSLSR